jgi:hypothetical protein
MSCIVNYTFTPADLDQPFRNIFKYDTIGIDAIDCEQFGITFSELRDFVVAFDFDDDYEDDDEDDRRKNGLSAPVTKEQISRCLLYLACTSRGNEYTLRSWLQLFGIDENNGHLIDLFNKIDWWYLIDIL